MFLALAVETRGRFPLARMIARACAVLRSNPSLVLILAAFALLLQRAGLSKAPILWDHAYFTTLGQAILRGEPIYANSFLGYPPLGPLLSAASMGIGRWFGTPTYLAPRYLAAPLAAASAVLLHLLVRRATGSAWCGMLAGIVLIGFQFFLSTTVSTLTPKGLVVILTLAACLAAQARRWGAVGVASGLAATCWQPAALIPIALFAVVAREARARPGKALSAWAVGLFVGALPAVVYLTISESWWHFLQRSIVIPATAQLGTNTDPLHWLSVAWRQFSDERILFLAGGAGFVWFLAAGLRGGFRGLLVACLDPRLGGMPVLTLAWASFNSLEFGAAPDMLPFLPIVAFWVAWLSHRLVAGLSFLGTVGGARAVGRRLASVSKGAIITAAAVFAAFNTPTFPYTLATQEIFIKKIVKKAGLDGTVMCFSASEIYAISERASPQPFLRLTDAFIPFLPLVGLDGCRAVMLRMFEQRPEVVVINLWRHSSECERRIAERLPENGYVLQVAAIAGMTWRIFWLPWWDRLEEDPSGSIEAGNPAPDRRDRPPTP